MNWRKPTWVTSPPDYWVSHKVHLGDLMILLHRSAGVVTDFGMPNAFSYGVGDVNQARLHEHAEIDG